MKISKRWRDYCLGVILLPTLVVGFDYAIKKRQAAKPDDVVRLRTELAAARDSLRLETARHDSLKAAVAMINYTKYPGPNDCFNGVVALAGIGLNPGYHAVGVAQYDSTYAAMKPYLNTIKVEWQ